MAWADWSGQAGISLLARLRGCSGRCGTGCCPDAFGGGGFGAGVRCLRRGRRSWRFRLRRGRRLWWKGGVPRVEWGWVSVSARGFASFVDAVVLVWRGGGVCGWRDHGDARGSGVAHGRSALILWRRRFLRGFIGAVLVVGRGDGGGPAGEGGMCSGAGGEGAEVSVKGQFLPPPRG